MENNKFKKVRIKNRTYYYFDDTIKLEDSHLDNILMDKKSHENILICNISYKTFTVYDLSVHIVQLQKKTF